MIPYPYKPYQPKLCHYYLFLSPQVGYEIGSDEVPVIIIENSSNKPHQKVLLPESARPNRLNDLLQLSGNVILGTRRAHLMFQCIDFLHSRTKYEDVVLSNFLVDLNVRAIHSSNNETPIHHEFHVASAWSLCSCSRDMLAEVRGRDDNLGVRNVVVGKENYF